MLFFFPVDAEYDTAGSYMLDGADDFIEKMHGTESIPHEQRHVLYRAFAQGVREVANSEKETKDAGTWEGMATMLAKELTLYAQNNQTNGKVPDASYQLLSGTWEAYKEAFVAKTDAEDDRVHSIAAAFCGGVAFAFWRLTDQRGAEVRHLMRFAIYNSLKRYYLADDEYRGYTLAEYKELYRKIPFFSRQGMPPAVR